MIGCERKAGYYRHIVLLCIILTVACQITVGDSTVITKRVLMTVQSERERERESQLLLTIFIPTRDFIPIFYSKFFSSLFTLKLNEKKKQVVELNLFFFSNHFKRDAKIGGVVYSNFYLPA